MLKDLETAVQAKDINKIKVIFMTVLAVELVSKPDIKPVITYLIHGCKPLKDYSFTEILDDFMDQESIHEQYFGEFESDKPKLYDLINTICRWGEYTGNYGN